MSAYPSYTRIFVPPSAPKRCLRLVAGDDTLPSEGCEAITEVSPLDADDTIPGTERLPRPIVRVRTARLRWHVPPYPSGVYRTTAAAPHQPAWPLALWLFFPALLALGGVAFAQRYLTSVASTLVSFVIAMAISRWRESRR